MSTSRGGAARRPRTSAAQAIAALRAVSDPARAEGASRYFKAGPGGYAEGDRFLGVTVPATRAVLRACSLDLLACEELLASEWHEARLLALLAMVRLYQRGSPELREAIFRSYLAHTPRVNNWDLVDSSAPYIVGAHLFGKSTKLLTTLARSPVVWERRIAMLATFHFLREGDPGETLRLAVLLERDPHDLVHKAIGWMLRELGQRCGLDVLRAHLAAHAATLPRTALRYAIEKLDPRERRRWMDARAGEPGQAGQGGQAGQRRGVRASRGASSRAARPAARPPGRT